MSRLWVHGRALLTSAETTPEHGALNKPRAQKKSTSKRPSRCIESIRFDFIIHSPHSQDTEMSTVMGRAGTGQEPGTAWVVLSLASSLSSSRLLWQDRRVRGRH